MVLDICLPEYIKVKKLRIVLKTIQSLDVLICFYIYILYIYVYVIYMFLYIDWNLDMLSHFLHNFVILKMFVLLIFSMNCFFL